MSSFQHMWCSVFILFDCARRGASHGASAQADGNDLLLATLGASGRAPVSRHATSHLSLQQLVKADPATLSFHLVE